MAQKIPGDENLAGGSGSSTTPITQPSPSNPSFNTTVIVVIAIIVVAAIVFFSK